jgi:diguanylate cyclase (GGDEF)-like protein
MQVPHAPPIIRWPPITRWLERSSARVVVAVALALVSLIGAVDHLTGDEISVSVFYLLPVTLVTWRLLLHAGISMAVLSAAVWLGVDVATQVRPIHPAIHLWNSLVRLGFFVIVASLLDRIRSGYREAAASARTDPLTGLANRRRLEEDTAVEIARARRNGRPLTMAVVDLDDFKKVNDSLGHAAGDRLLRALAAALTASRRAGDVVARIGGDEFVLMLPDTSAADAMAVLERVRTEAAAAVTGELSPDRFSLGAVTFLVPPRDVHEALRRVDALLYSAKRSGKGITRFEVVGSTSRAVG